MIVASSNEGSDLVRELATRRRPSECSGAMPSTSLRARAGRRPSLLAVPLLAKGLRPDLSMVGARQNRPKSTTQARRHNRPGRASAADPCVREDKRAPQKRDPVMSLVPVFAYYVACRAAATNFFAKFYYTTGHQEGTVPHRNRPARIPWS
eukprot:5171349-Prymnesium_polylepis.2